MIDVNYTGLAVSILAITLTYSTVVSKLYSSYQADEALESMSPSTARVVVLGDPHSGKSCFIAALHKACKGSYTWQEVCPDGEGQVFHGLMSAGLSTVARAYKTIRRSNWSMLYAVLTAEKVATLQGKHLLDAGGKRTEHNAHIARQADYAVVLYKSEASKQQWLDWCSTHGIRVLYCVNSNMVANDTEHAVSGLKRGVDASTKPAVRALARTLVTL